MSETTSFLPLDLDDAALCQAVFEHASVSMLIVDVSGQIVLFNEKSEELFGYQRAEILGQPVELLIPPESVGIHQHHRANYYEHFQHKSLKKGRCLQAKKKNGEVFPIEISLGGLEVGNSRFVLAVIEDVSEKNDIERQLQESQHQLASIIQNAVDGIITIGSQGDILTVNPSAAQLFGYEEEEMVGQNINMLMPEPFHTEHDGYLENYHQTRRRKIIGIGREVKGKRKDGSIFPFYLSVSEVKLEDRTIFTGIVHDLTEQKRAEMQLKKYSMELEKRVHARTRALAQAMEGMEKEIRERKEIEQELIESRKEIEHALDTERKLNELKSRFVSMASHEFRTPLATILSSVALINRYQDNSLLHKRNRHIDRIKSNVKNLTQILDDFLSLSKLEEGKVEVRPKEFLLQEFGQELTEEIQTHAKDRQLIVHRHEGEETPIFLDPQLLKNICYNFLSNAIKYSPEASTIHFITYKQADSMRIEVIDEGIGIPADDQEHMFERFFRAKNAINIKGTGLGLSIVKRYVDLMNGNMGFESKEGEGTTFWVQFHLS